MTRAAMDHVFHALDRILFGFSRLLPYHLIGSRPSLYRYDLLAQCAAPLQCPCRTSLRGFEGMHSVGPLTLPVPRLIGPAPAIFVFFRTDNEPVQGCPGRCRFRAATFPRLAVFDGQARFSGPSHLVVDTGTRPVGYGAALPCAFGIVPCTSTDIGIRKAFDTIASACEPALPFLRV